MAYPYPLPTTFKVLITWRRVPERAYFAIGLVDLAMNPEHRVYEPAVVHVIQAAHFVSEKAGDIGEKK